MSYCNILQTDPDRIRYRVHETLWKLPDLDAIGNIWAILESWFGKRPRLPTNTSEFFTVASEVWEKEISFDAINACIDSMEKQAQIVKAHKGGSTRC